MLCLGLCCLAVIFPGPLSGNSLAAPSISGCNADDLDLAVSATRADMSAGKKKIQPPGPLYYQGVDLLRTDIEQANKLLLLDGSPLALCYLAMMREQGAIAPQSASDSAETLLERARAQISPPDGGWQDSDDDWEDVDSPLMGKILSTMFHINSNIVSPQG